MIASLSWFRRASTAILRAVSGEGEVSSRLRLLFCGYDIVLLLVSGCRSARWFEVVFEEVVFRRSGFSKKWFFEEVFFEEVFSKKLSIN